MQDNRIPRQIDGFKLEEFDNEILLFNISRDETIYMNDTAAEIWNLCNGERNIEQIAGLIGERYPGESETIKQDLRETFEALVNYGAIAYR